MDRTLSGAATPGQSGPGSDGNEEVLCIPQSSSITVTSSFDCLMSCAGHSLWEGVLLQSVYIRAPDDWKKIGILENTKLWANNIDTETS